MPRVWVLVGVLALGYLQARLWILPGNLRVVAELEARRDLLVAENAAQEQLNQEQESWVRLLESDLRSIEFQARSDLGLVREGETLFVVPQ